MERVQKYSQLLDELLSFEDPQVALRLLRNCAGVCKVTHSMCMTPPALHSNALADFDNKVRDTFSHTTGILPSSSQWEQATCGLKYAGVGLRSAQRHSQAAFLTSSCTSKDRCYELDKHYMLDAANPTSEFGQALAGYNAMLPVDQHLAAPDIIGIKQQALSVSLDKAVFEARRAEECPANKATLLSECERGARDLWQAVPNHSGGTAMPAAEFCAELRYRLCIPSADNSSWCPLCNDVLDQFGHHSRRCCAGGDRVVRHNALRNVVFNFCCTAGLRPVLEKPGLLLPARPSEISSQRRPADIYLPCWTGGLPAALDFAVTAPQRQEIVSEAAHTPLAAAKAYSQSKRDHQGTQDACDAQGIRFQPMVCETSGAWSTEALEVLQLIAKAAASHTGSDHKTLLQGTLQRCAAVVRKANARAHFKRYN